MTRVFRFEVDRMMYKELSTFYTYVHRAATPEYLGRLYGVIYSQLADIPDIKSYLDREVQEISDYHAIQSERVQDHFQTFFYPLIRHRPSDKKHIHFMSFWEPNTSSTGQIEITIDYPEETSKGVEVIRITDENIMEYFDFHRQFQQDRMQQYGDAELGIYTLLDDDYYQMHNTFPEAKQYEELNEQHESGSCRNFTFQVTEDCNLRCFAAGTKVLMADYTERNIEDVHLGDMVLGFEEYSEQNKQRHLKPVMVTRTFHRMANVIKLTTPFAETYVTPNHKFLTARNRWVEIGKLTDNEGLLKLEIDPDLYRPLDINVDYKTGYLTAAFLGDGCISEKTSSFVVKDNEMNDRVLEYLHDFGIQVKTYPFMVSKKYNVVAGRIYTRSEEQNKRLLSIILSQYNSGTEKSTDFLMGFLAGAIDAEGHVEDSSIRVYNADARYLYYVQQALNAINVKYTMDPISFGVNKSVSILRVLGGAQAVLTVLKSCCLAIRRKCISILHGASIYTRENKYQIDRSLLNEDAVPVYNIETESATYIANRVLSHNCSYCFPKGTKVTMADYTKRNIEDIKIGDQVLGFDEDPQPNGRRFKVATVTNLFNREADCIRISASDMPSDIIVTPEHPYLTARGWVAAWNLKKDDTLLRLPDPSGEYEDLHVSFQIRRKTIKPVGKHTVYNLETDTHTFLADDYLVHNCYQINKCASIMDLETGKSAVDDLLAGNFDYLSPGFSKSVILEFIGGDPLLEIDLIGEIYSYFLQEAYRLNHPWFYHHRLSMCTNAMLYFSENTKRFFDKFARQVSFNVSIDGNKALHDSCRIQPTGEGSYDIGIAAVHHSVNVYKMDLSSKMTLAPSNIPMIAESVKNLCFDNSYPGVNLNCVFEDVWSKEDATLLFHQLIQVADMVYEKKRPELFFSIYRNLPLLDDRSNPAEVLTDTCFKAGTLIYTPDGNQNIEDIQVGDKVYSASGTIMTVTKVHQHMSYDNVRVHAFGTTVYCTSTHKFFARRKVSGKLTSLIMPPDFYPIGNLVAEDLIAVPRIVTTLENLRKDDIYPVYWTPIQSIEKDTVGVVYNLTVEGPATENDPTGEHTYIANGFAVSNCGGGNSTMLSISPDGTYYPCIRYMPSSLGDDVNAIVLGNKTDKLQEENPLLHEFNMLTYLTSQNDKCLSCPFESFCSNCTALRYQYFGTPNQRTTTLCDIARVEYLAAVYYWSKIKMLVPEFHLELDDTVAPYYHFRDVVTKEEYDMVVKTYLEARETDQ